MESFVSKRRTASGATASFVGTESAYGPQDKQHDPLITRTTTRKTNAMEISNATTATEEANNLQRDPIYVWSSLIAGVGSGVLSSVICAPLDLVRTRMQVWSVLKMPTSSLRQAILEIAQKEGWQGYFRGLGASLVTVPAFWGVYFPLYDDMKRYWMAKYPDTNPSWVHCGSAVTAGAVSDVICNPMFVIRTRLQTEALHNIADGTTKRGSSGIIRTAKALYQEGRVPIFWRGMTANLFGLSHVAVQFPVYEWLKTQLVHQRVALQHKRHPNTPVDEELTAMDYFLASGLSKMTASLLTYPHEVIRSRMMDARGAGGISLLKTARRVYMHDGVLGFYSGLPVALVRVIPNCCITFMTYELLLRMAREEMKKHRSEKIPSK